MFWTVPLSIIRSFSLYKQQWYMLYRYTDFLILLVAVSKLVWHIPLLFVRWKTPDDGQRNYPKNVEFYSKNKFEKLVHLVGFIVRNLLRCSVTWTSNCDYQFLFPHYRSNIAMGCHRWRYVLLILEQFWSWLLESWGLSAWVATLGWWSMQHSTTVIQSAHTYVKLTALLSLLQT